MEEKKKGNGSLIFAIVCVVFAIAAVCLMLVLGKGGLKGNTSVDNKVNNNTVDTGEKEQEKEEGYADPFDILSLKENEESYEYGDYKLVFTADKIRDDGTIESYALKIAYKNKAISNVFSNKKGLDIYHDNISMTMFKVRKIENVYILMNELGMPGYNQTILILDDSGNVLKEYEYAHHTEIDDNNKITINYNINPATRDTCGETPDGICDDATDTFTISGNKLIK